MRRLFNLFVFIVICFPISCCLVVRPRPAIEEPKVAVAILWDSDTIFITSKSPFTVSYQDRTIPIDANTVLSVTERNDKIVVIKSLKVLLIEPNKIIFESSDEISVGNNIKAMMSYHKKVEIKQNIIHRFPVKYNLTAVNVLPIETYLYGVVSSEIGMAKEEELEAVKAQAVCARSYTMSLLGKRKDFDLYGSYLYDQEYKGKNREYPLVVKAVNETRGEIMSYKDEPVLAQYHACCGGRTTFGRYPYLKSINDAPKRSSHANPYCKNAPYFEWNVKISRDSFEATVLKLAGITYKFRVNPKVDINKKTKRVDYFEFKADKEYKVPAESFRKALNLKSTFFTLKIKNDSVEIQGHGWGHGIGLCQYGALEMAQQKIFYKNILKHYYSGIKLIRIF